jgi:hypothetical protein
MKFYLVLFFSLFTLAKAISLKEIAIKNLCSNPKELSCSCKDLRVEVGDLDIGEFTITKAYVGGFSSKNSKEAVLKSVGCEGHFDIDENENLVPINYSGYIFMRKVKNRWKVISYRAFDLGRECFKIHLSRKDALVCKQDYDSIDLSLTRILLYTFSRNGSIYAKAIYRGSQGDKDIDDRIKKWRFRDLDGDGKRDIEIFTRDGKRVVFIRRDDEFVKLSRKKVTKPKPRYYPEEDEYNSDYKSEEYRPPREYQPKYEEDYPNYQPDYQEIPRRPTPRREIDIPKEEDESYYDDFPPQNPPRDYCPNRRRSNIDFRKGPFWFKIPEGFSRVTENLYRYYKPRATLYIILKKYNRSLKNYYVREIRNLKAKGIKIPYKVIRPKKGWFVISYYNYYGDIVYEKITKKGSYLFGYKLINSPNLKREFDPIIKLLNKSIKYSPKPTPKHNLRYDLEREYFQRARRCERRFRRCTFECLDRGEQCLNFCEQRKELCYKMIK